MPRLLRELLKKSALTKADTDIDFVRIPVRHITPGNVGMNLVYEIADSQGRSPYKNVGAWFSFAKDAAGKPTPGR